MTLFLQNDGVGVGSGAVFPNLAEADLFLISNQDLQLGETTQPPPSNLIEVTYDNPAETGTCPTRLHDLVTTDFTMVPGHPVDIIILAVDDSFLLADGTTMANNGQAMGWSGSGLPGASNNATNSVVVVYDATPSNICEKGLASQQYDLPSNSTATLYHELSHALRLATNSLLSLAASGCPSSAEERQASLDGNDLRTQQSLPLRDADDHCGQPCNAPSNCCIVASIATGSHSGELNRLRQVRDGFLRRSEIGYDFFDRLHYDYYAFSPEVVRAMAADEALVDDIRTYYVRPLTAMLSLARDRLIAGAGPAAIGERFVETLVPELREAPGPVVADAIRILEGDGHPATPRLPRTPAHAASSPHVQWALVDTIAMYLRAVRELAGGCPPERIGHGLTRRLDSWSARMPITGVWRELSDYDCRQELGWLAESLLRSRGARRRFARRLQEEHGDRPGLSALLDEAGYTWEKAA